MRKAAIIAISLAALLTGCAMDKTELRQLETHDGYLVECASNVNGITCDWEHQVKK